MLFYTFLIILLLYLCFSHVPVSLHSPQSGHITWSYTRTGINMASIAEFPCGSCKEEVSDSDSGVQCDSCMQWFHAHCQNISSPQYAVYASLESFSWVCLSCGSPNYSSGHIESLSSLPVSNPFSVLESSDLSDDCIYLKTTIKDNSSSTIPESYVFNPAANDSCVSPTQPLTSTPKKVTERGTNPSINQFSKLKVICINCQSIQSAEKRARFYAFVDFHKPDIVIGTESWLHKDIPDCEVFPASLGFNPPIRKDRPGDTKGGGVFILVSQRLVVSEQPQLSANCEIVWAKVQVVGAKPLLIAAYYCPSEHDQVSTQELKNSLSCVDPSKQHVWVLGDFNYPKLDWEENQPIIKQNCPNQEAYLDFVSIIDDSCLTQMVSEPTRENNILDLFLTNSPTLVDSVSVVPGIADHLAVIGVVRLRPTIQKVKPRTVLLYSKANWEGMRQGMQEFQATFLATCEGKSTEQLWQEFMGETETLIGWYVPTKTLRGRKNLPWITQEIRRKMNRRDNLYHIQKTTGKDSHRQLFKKVKYEVDCMTKTSYNAYLHSLVGITDKTPDTDSSRPNTKNSSPSSKTAGKIPKAVHPSKRMNNCAPIMSRRQISLSANFNRCSPLSPPLHLNSSASRKFRTSKNQVIITQIMSLLKLGISTHA